MGAKGSTEGYMTAFSSGAEIGGAISDASSIKQEAEFQRQQYEFDARMADLQAKDVKRIGEKNAVAHSKQIKKLVGSQRAALAAQGIDVGTDTAMDIQNETYALGREEMDTIRTNAYKEAMGIKMSAVNSRAAGRMAELSGKNRARSTLLTGGIKSFGRGSKFYFGNPPSKTDSKKKGIG